LKLRAHFAAHFGKQFMRDYRGNAPVFSDKFFLNFSIFDYLIVMSFTPVTFLVRQRKAFLRQNIRVKSWLSAGLEICYSKAEKIKLNYQNG
jgi:hypothetical protein